MQRQNCMKYKDVVQKTEARQSVKTLKAAQLISALLWNGMV